MTVTSDEAQITAPVALTCGEPSGIGPEIALKAWQTLRDSLPFFLIGDRHHLPHGAPFVEITCPKEALEASRHALPLLQHGFAAPAASGKPAAENAGGVIETIEIAVDLVKSGAASAICTAPINKKALKDGAGFAYPGHTEFLAHLAGVERVVMMLASPEIRVVPTTIHIPLKDVPKVLSAELLRETLLITDAGLKQDFGISQPRLAVAGLNPHAGEGGAMGNEEITFIAPLLKELRKQGLNIKGPLPADTMFHAAARAQYDVAVCMYHDQALIPIKTLDFDRGVNITLGLPFVRTSPDHGTAFDIAGQNRANPSSLIEALKLAAQMARARRKAR